MRRDLHATAIYEFLGTSPDKQVSVLIDRSDIAGAEPASGEALLIDRWIFDVTRDHVATADDDFAFAIRFERSTQFIENSNFRPCRDTNRAKLAYSGWQWIAGNLVGSLGHPVGFENRYAEQLL